MILRALITAVSLAVAAPAPMTLQFWHSMSGEKGKLLQSLVDGFNDLPENRGKLSVILQFVGSYEEGLNKLRISVIARRTPHITQVTDIGTAIMADSDVVAPLQDFIDRDPSFPSARLLPQIRRYYEIGGRLYSLPFATSNPVLYCNVDALAKAGLARPPRTWDELRTWARRLTDKEKRTTGLTWPLHSWFLEEFLARQGADLADHGNGRRGRATQVLLTSPEAVAFVRFWKDLVDEGIFANVGRGWEPAEQNFLAGRSAMFITSTSDVFEVAKKAPFKVVCAPVPSRDPKAPGGVIVGGNSLWILKDHPPEERAAAYRFVRYMASAEVQRRWHQGTGYFPIRADVIAALEKEGFYKEHPSAKTAIDQLRASAPITATQGALLGSFSETREYVDSAVEQVLSGAKDVPAALAWAEQRADAALARYNRSR